MPKFTVHNFTGGINNAIESDLLEDRFATDLLDANIENGKLNPHVAKAEVNDPKIDLLTNQDGNRSLVKFGDEVYYSDNRDGTLNSTLGFFGITPPGLGLTATFGGFGDRFQGKFRYLLRFRTKDGHRSAPFTIPTEEIAPLVVNAELIKTETLTLTDLEIFSGNRFIRFVNTDGGRTVIANIYGYFEGERVNHNSVSWKARADIFVEYLVAQTIPDPAIPQNKHPGGSEDLWEDISGATDTVSGVSSIILSNFPGPAESAVDTIEIYRTLVNGTVYYLNAAVNVDIDRYIDLIPDGELILKEQLTIRRGLPPITVIEAQNQTRRVGGKYLTGVNERFWLAVGNFLHHSLQSDPHSWNPLHRVHFDNDITALARFGSAIVVFIGDGAPSLVLGNVEDGDLQVIDIPVTQGCPDWKTIAYAGNTPVWKSNEGVCVMTKFPSGQDPQITVVSKDRYTFSVEPNFALAKDDCYHLFFDDHAVLFDFGRDRITRRSLTADYGFFSNLDGILYLVENSTIFDADGGSRVAYTYESPDFYTRNRDVLKSFDRLTFDANSAVIYSVWLDGELAVNAKTTTETSGIFGVKLPRIQAYRIKLKLQTTAKLRSFSVEYTPNREGES